MAIEALEACFPALGMERDNVPFPSASDRGRHPFLAIVFQYLAIMPLLGLTVKVKVILEIRYIESVLRIYMNAMVWESGVKFKKSLLLIETLMMFLAMIRD